MCAYYITSCHFTFADFGEFADIFSIMWNDARFTTFLSIVHTFLRPTMNNFLQYYVIRHLQLSTYSIALLKVPKVLIRPSVIRSLSRTAE